MGLWERRFEKRLPLLYTQNLLISRIGMFLECCFGGSHVDDAWERWFDWLKDRGPDKKDKGLNVDDADMKADRQAALSMMQ